jgi:glucan phosphorylase
MPTYRKKQSESPRADDLVEALRRGDPAGVPLAGHRSAFYDRHLEFDTVAAPQGVGTRERFEAFARSFRDILTERWLRTEHTYAQMNPKRVYYLSMEFLIGRQLANTVTNLMLKSQAEEFLRHIVVDWLKLLEEEPDAGLGNGGLGRLAACFLDSLATLQIPAMGYGLRYEYGMFRQEIVHGWQQERSRWHYENEPEARAALDAIAADAFSTTEPGVFRPLHDALIAHGDYYMHLADLQSYLCADARLSATYRVRESWQRMAIPNIAASGYFSSDRTVAQYASDIWDATPCPILHAP